MTEPWPDTEEDGHLQDKGDEYDLADATREYPFNNPNSNMLDPWEG